MSSLFSRIVAGEIPCHRVAENENFLAFLDIQPLAKGHTLVIPKKETDYIFDIESDEYQALWLFAKEVASLLKSKLPCKRIGVTVIGLEVPHAHIHLIPISQLDDMNFSRPKLNPSSEELHDLAAFLIA
jgi:histidine triad (HIT) family protein